jgi:NAD+--asparagine ADP-ribosyltransferase
MTIDERIERLTERHEALTQSVELVLVATRENTESIRKLVEVTNRDAEDIRALARIAEIHDRRITNIEGGGLA